ncbi:hypothetical protein QBC42DRAFT_23191 [Cladorrhinum samala]|uniref:Uncharacterized protein n=1 Tax=Cladorrhinum samala TaxID=585594 RepID=A0AAV9HFC5_9PEZI|nr:hypothetical protein QBC42DRAFT_23191 [Cladorrhinum samala]
MNGNPESSIKFTNPPPWENKEKPRGDRTNDEVVGITPRDELPSSSASSVTAAGDEEHMTPSDESASFLSHSEDGYDEDEDEIGEGSGMGKDDYDEEKGSLRLPRKRPQPRAAAAAATVTTAVRTRPLYSEEEERAVIKKFDRKLVLFVALLYLLAFLDRSSMVFFFFFVQ